MPKSHSQTSDPCPKRGLRDRRLPPTQQTARKGRLNFLYAAERRSVLVSPTRFQQLIEQRLDQPDGGRGDLVLSLAENPEWLSMLEAEAQRQRGAGSQYS